MVFHCCTTETPGTTSRRHPLAARPWTAFVLALLMSSAVVVCAGSRTGKELPPGSVELSGAGATFPAPLYKKWLEVYHS